MDVTSMDVRSRVGWIYLNCLIMAFKSLFGLFQHFEGSSSIEVYFWIIWVQFESLVKIR